MIFDQQELESLPDGGGASCSAGHRIETPAGPTAWIDYAGRPTTVKYISFVDVEHNKFNPADGARQGRRGRRDRDVAAGPAQHVDHAQRADAGPGDPGERRSQTALEGFPLRDVAVVAQRRC